MDQIPLVHSFFSTVIEQRDSLDKETFIDVCRTQSWRFAWDEIFPFFMMSQLCNQVYLAERKMGTLWSSKFEFFVPEKNTKQNVQRIKTRNFRLFYCSSFRWKQKKNYFIYTLRYTSAENLMLGIIAVCLHWATAQTRISGKNANMNMVKSCTQYEALANIERCRDVRKFCT